MVKEIGEKRENYQQNQNFHIVIDTASALGWPYSSILFMLSRLYLAFIQGYFPSLFIYNYMMNRSPRGWKRIEN